MACAYIYGDSLLKATVPDEQFRYHFHLPEVMERYSGRQTEVVNRSKMGATIRKGQARGARPAAGHAGAITPSLPTAATTAISIGTPCRTAPGRVICPGPRWRTSSRSLLQMLRQLKDKGVQPVLMTLPPIDAQRYLDFLCRNGRSKERIMDWLGDTQHIYRHQELYSDTVARLAYETGTPLIGVREIFLGEKRLPGLYCRPTAST